MYRATHGRRSDARTAIYIAAYMIVALIIGLLVVFVGDRMGERGGHDKKPPAKTQPAGILRR